MMKQNNLKKSLLSASFLGTLGAATFFTPHANVQAFPGQEPSFFERGNEQFEQTIEQFQQSQPDTVLTIDESVQPDAEQRWQPLTSAKGQFSMWAPLGLISQDFEAVPFESETLAIEILSSLSAHGNFFVAHTDLSPGLEASALFDSVTETLVSETAFTLNGTTDISADGFTIESFMLTGENSYLLGFSLLGEVDGTERLYVVGVRQDGQTVPSEEARRFLESFELTAE